MDIFETFLVEMGDYGSNSLRQKGKFKVNLPQLKQIINDSGQRVNFSLDFDLNILLCFLQF